MPHGGLERVGILEPGNDPACCLSGPVAACLIFSKPHCSHLEDGDTSTASLLGLVVYTVFFSACGL